MPPHANCATTCAATGNHATICSATIALALGELLQARAIATRQLVTRAPSTLRPTCKRKPHEPFVGATEESHHRSAPSALPPTRMRLEELRHMRALLRHQYVGAALHHTLD